MGQQDRLDRRQASGNPAAAVSIRMLDDDVKERPGMLVTLMERVISDDG
jgi:hypothetical protein